MWIVIAVIAFLSAMATSFVAQGTKQTDQAKAIRVAMEGEQLHSVLSIARAARHATSCHTGPLSWNTLFETSHALGMAAVPSQSWCGTDGACSKQMPAGKAYVLGAAAVCGSGGEVIAYRLGSKASQHSVYADVAMRSYALPVGSMKVGFANGSGHLYKADGTYIPVSSPMAKGLLKNLPAGALVVLGSD